MLQRYKDNLADFHARHKRMPTYAEMARMFGFKSKNSVHRLMAKLRDEGIVRKDKGGKIVPDSLLQREVRILGYVEAGFPTPTDEELHDTMTLDEYLIDNREASYLLKVKGDSMIEAAIREGDMVLVERTQKYKPGDIVIAEVDGAWTMKYLRQQGNYYYLEPANKKYKPIFPKESLTIAAVVRAVIRKY